MNDAPIRRVIDALAAHGCAPRQVGNRWEAKCPAHDGKHRCLDVRTGDDGRVLIHDNGGGQCAPDRIVAAIGLTMADLFPPKPPAATPKKAAARRGRLVKTYDYRDADGALLFQVCRYNPKTFRQRRPYGNGRWTWNMNGVSRVLYRLPELRAADRAEPIIIVEGEKDADALAAVGLVSTTNPGGAGKWGKLADDSALHGRRCIIIPDRDEAGRRHAQDVARRLFGKAADVHVVELPGENVKDAADWIGAQNGNGPDVRAALLALAETAPAWQESGEEEPAPDGTEDPQPVLVCLGEVERKAVEWLWRGRIPRGKVTLLAGDPGLGKSVLALDVAARVTRGLTWPDGASGCEPGGVIVLSAEDDVADTILPRLEAAGADLAKVHALQGVAFKATDCEVQTVRAFRLDTDLAVLDRAVVATPGCALVIVDPISAYLGRIDSHVNSDVRVVLGALKEVAERHQVAVVAIQHLNKNPGGAALYRVTGSLAFTAAARVVWLVSKDGDDPTRRLLLPGKNNLAAEGTGLAFSLMDSPDLPDVVMVTWFADPVTVTADDALAPEDREEAGAIREGVAWLREVLVDGPVSVQDLQERAKADGHAWKTLKRAKHTAGVVSFKRGYGVDGKWVWGLRPKGAITQPMRNLAPLGKVGPLRVDGPENPVSEGVQTAHHAKGGQGSGVAPLDAAETAFRRRSAEIQAAQGCSQDEADNLALEEELARGQG